MAVASPPKTPSSQPGGAQASKAGSGKYFFLGKYRSLLTVCLILAAGVHVLGLLIFGTITLFKGSVPRMPFTSEGIPAEDVGAEAPMEEESAPAEEAASSPDSAAASSEAASEDTETVLAVTGVTSQPSPFAAAPAVPSARTGLPGGTGSFGGGGGGKGKGSRSSVNFFGVKGEGTNVYFVVDLSDSMLEPERGGVAGFSIVKKQLKQMIQSLDEGTRFNVVTYGAAGVDLFQPASVPATADKKQAAAEFIDRYNTSTEKKGTQNNNYRPSIPEFGLIQGDKGTGRITTRLDLGLLAALEGLADTIFLISDGKAPVLAEDRRKEAAEAMKQAEIPEGERIKYEKEVEEWRRQYEKYTAELKAYREKYKDLLAKRDQKIQEAKAKGEGKVREGYGVDYGVRIPGLPSQPVEPRQPEPPKPKAGGKVVQTAGEIYDETTLIKRIRDVYTEVYKKGNAPTPSIHTVGYMSKSAEAKFLQNLAVKNNGTYKAISAPIKDAP